MEIWVAFGFLLSLFLAGGLFLLREKRATKRFVLHVCRMTCIGGSEKGTCSCLGRSGCRLSALERERFKQQFSADFKRLGRQ